MAIVVGTAALILVLSVFNGFEGLVKSLYSSFYTDVKISAVTGKFITVSPAQLARLKATEGVRNFSLVVEEKALLQNGENQSVIHLKGVDDNYRYITGVADNMADGLYEIGKVDTPKLILGAGVESALQLTTDAYTTPLRVYLPRKGGGEQLNILEDISNNAVSFSGSFRIQQDFDNKYGLTTIDFVKKAMKMQKDEYSAIEIAVSDPELANEVKRELKKIFAENYLVQDKYEQNRSLYSIMNVERWVIYGILCLILVVAAFNMIGSLTMLVLEKQKDISVLHAMGAGKIFIQKIFLSEGFLLALIGGGIGMLLALVIALLQLKYHLIPLQGGSFLISYFPVKLRFADFLLVGTTVLIIALLASWLPSRKAASSVFSLRSE